MKVSIISAAYNVLSSIGLARMTASIRSVAAIPVEHEHLIFDGASTDGTVEALRKFEAEIPSLRVVSERDSGIYDALNKGLRAAQGEFFYVLGLDDIIANPGGFAEVVEAAISDRDDVWVAQMIREGARHPFPREMRNALKEFARQSYGHQGVLVRTEFARSEKIGLFDTSYRIAADYKQLLTLHWNDAKVGVSAKLIAVFADSGVSSKFRAQSAGEALRAKKELYQLDESEFKAMKASGRLPLRVALHYLRSSSSFSRRMGIMAIWAYVFRKHKNLEGSTYFLLGMPIFRHRRKLDEKAGLQKGMEMLARLAESFYRKLVTPLDQRLIDLTFAVEPSQAAVDALLKEWDIEVAGAGKAGLLSYVLNAHPELDFGDYTAPRLKGLFMRNRFANLKLVAHFTKVGRRLNDLGLRPLVIKGGAMKFLRPELPRDMGDIDFLLPTRAEVERVCGLVRELGYQGEIGGSNHAATIRAPDGAEVMDIHWTMDFMSSYDSDVFWTGVRARSRACKVFGVDALVPAAEDLLFIVLQNLAKNLRKQQTLKGAVFSAFDGAWLQARPGFDVSRVIADVRETQTDFNAALAARFINRIVPGLLPPLLTDALGASPRVQEQLNQAFFYSHRLVRLRRDCRALRHDRPFASPVKAARFLAMEFRRLWLSIFNKRPRLLALYLALFPPREEELCA